MKFPMEFGTEKEVVSLDDSGSTLTLIRKVRDGMIAKTQKQFKVRVKVADKKQEMAEYLSFTDLVDNKRTEGVLILKDEDPALVPSFCIEFPKFNQDNSYFVVKCWSEYVS